MAKGLRSKSSKVHKAQLRSRVFGPVESARNERLSSKLLQLASKPRDTAAADVRMKDVDESVAVYFELLRVFKLLISAYLDKVDPQKQQSKRLGRSPSDQNGNVAAKNGLAVRLDQLIITC